MLDYIILYVKTSWQHKTLKTHFFLNL
uniref:Uncharacterized protein n=1 Tax=Anguilla anguilla TaxID=7936 RepID=A0A0E9SD64_ANGAN